MMSGYLVQRGEKAQIASPAISLYVRVGRKTASAIATKRVKVLAFNDSRKNVMVFVRTVAET